MIRFCNQKMKCVAYNLLHTVDRKKLLDFFLSDHEDDLICVYEDFNSMKYIGIITYYSLRKASNIHCAILKEYVTIDNDIWLNARNFFSHYVFEFQEHVLLPILDLKGHLVCFAYEDAEANREIRMLKELLEMPGALQFSDIYPEYKRVKIYGFNELAYFFAKYLERTGIQVEVIGEMWRGFFRNAQLELADDECLTIYAEGVGERKGPWTERLLTSVSVEFEHIDKVYEMNIRKGKIFNPKGDINSLLAYLRQKEEIIIYGTGCQEQAAYDYLMGEGIEACCFVGTNYSECSHTMFGKRIISGREARISYKKAVFIDCTHKNSAWGIGKVDYYDYIGYRRNEQFILLRDYVEFEGSTLLNVFCKTNVVLTGDVYLCRCLSDYLEQNGIFVKGYLDILSQKFNYIQISKVEVSEIDDQTTCLIVVPEFFEPEEFRDSKEVELKDRIITYLKEHRIYDYCDYFSYIDSFIHVEANVNMCINKQFLPKKVVIGSIEGYSGKVFFRGLLDSHPSIMMIHYSILNDDLIWICIRLSVVETSYILPLFWEICEASSIKLDKPSAFNDKMSKLIKNENRYSAQELFVMIHIAYMNMYEKDISEYDIKEMIIYWEPHFMEREILENCVKWFGTDMMSCSIINVVRNICISKGSAFKAMISKSWCKDKRIASYNVFSYPSINKEKIKCCDRVVVKFEDLKCNPRQNLLMICKKWDIHWSETLMATTYKGMKQSVYNQEREISDFDLEPVYNSYEKYFSEFDRFRIMLVNAPWQQTYGYPYVKIFMFSQRELQNMFIKKFRFEDMLEFENCKQEFEYKLQIRRYVSAQLQLARLFEYEHLKK